MKRWTIMITRLALGIGLALAVAASAEAGGNGRIHRPVPPRAPRPVYAPVAPLSLPQFYYKDQMGFAHPIIPVFVLPGVPPPAPVPVAKAPCQRFFCD